MRAGLLRSSRGRRRKDGMRAVWMPSVCLLPVPGQAVHQIGSTGQCSARSLGADGTPNEAGGKWGVCGPEAPGEVERGATAGQACSGSGDWEDARQVFQDGLVASAMDWQCTTEVVGSASAR
jgi:hypothetical protein